MYVAEKPLVCLISLPPPPVSWDYWGNHTWFIQHWESNPGFILASQALYRLSYIPSPQRKIWKRIARY